MQQPLLKPYAFNSERGTGRERRLQTKLWPWLLTLTMLTFSICHLQAQTGGEGAFTGTVTDSTGAVVPNAAVTAKNVETGVETSRPTSSAGIYQISPLIIGTYSVTVSAQGFETFKQEGLVINENQVFGLNPILRVGSETQTVTVTELPPALDTTNAVLGGTI
jgi:hypothetical protein